MRPLALGLVLLIPAAASAGEEPPRKPTAFEAIVRRIDPSARQCAELAALARQADAARAQLEATKRGALLPFRDALLRLREEVVSDRGLAAATTKAASSLKGTLKDAQTRFLKELAGLEEKALALLTPGQRARAGPVR